MATGYTEEGYFEPAIAWTGGAALITAVDNGGNLDFWWQRDGDSAWNQETASVPDQQGGTFFTPSIAWAPSGWQGGGAALITAADSAGNLDFWYQLDGTTPWNQETVAS